MCFFEVGSCLSIIGMGNVSKATMVDSFFFVNCYTSEISWRGVTSGCFSQVLEVFPPSLVDDNTLIHVNPVSSISEFCSDFGHSA